MRRTYPLPQVRWKRLAPAASKARTVLYNGLKELWLRLFVVMSRLDSLRAAAAAHGLDAWVRQCEINADPLVENFLAKVN